MADKSLPEQYAELAVKLYIMPDEECDSPEADAIRDKLDPIWWAMTPEQQDAAIALTHQAETQWRAQQ